MQLMFLGTGSAFCVTPNNYQSNLLLTSPSGRRLLIDCGSDVRHSLKAAGLTYSDIDDIYISHLHADHIGGLEYMGFSCKFDPAAELPNLIISNQIGDKLWNKSLAGSMTINEDEDPSTVSTYFKYRPVPSENHFQWEGIDFTLVPTKHVVGHNYTVLSYGLLFKINNTKIYLTTDTKFDPIGLASVLDDADLIFHDCEATGFPTGVHPHYSELVTLPARLKSKIWLYHYDDLNIQRPNAVMDGFLGLVDAGQTFTFD